MFRGKRVSGIRTPHQWSGIIVGIVLLCLVVALQSQYTEATGAPVNPPTLAKPVPKPRPGTQPATAGTTASNSVKAQSPSAASKTTGVSKPTGAPVVAVTSKSISVPTAPKLSAAAAVLLDVANGKVLYSLNPHVRRAPASLTKIVTGIVAVEKGNLNTVAKISAHAASEPPTHLGLSSGDRVRLSKLLDAALMGSNNDAATAIAEHISSSESAFARLMNDTARKIGAKESNFRNANGLDASGHYSTAYDLAIISRYALKKPTLAQIFARQRVYLTWEGGKSEVVNINSFLWRYSGAFGLKTGYTQDAGYSVSAGARHGSRSLIVVLLGCPSSDARWSDAERLMDYGFQHYSTLVAAAAVRVTGRIYIVKTGDTLYGIASRLGVKVADLIKINKALATNPNRLLPGQSLVIP